MQVSSVASKGQYKKKKIFQQNKKNLDIFILFKSFHPPALNAFCFLLEHQWMFEHFWIVVFESVNCPQCEKMDLKIIQSLLERVQICKRCWKTEDSAGHGGFFWRTVLSLTVQIKQGTHEQPSQNKKTSSRLPNTLLRTKGSQTFEGGYLKNFSYFFLLFFYCGLYVNIVYVKYLTQDSTK